MMHDFVNGQPISVKCCQMRNSCTGPHQIVREKKIKT